MRRAVIARLGRQEPSLIELVEELRTLRIDKSEARIDQIADDPGHPRSFDANRLIVEGWEGTENGVLTLKSPVSYSRPWKYRLMFR